MQAIASRRPWRWIGPLAIAGAVWLGAALAPVHASDDALNLTAGPQEWAGDLSPITERDWSPARAAHLLERAGFGGTPEDIQRLARMTPEQAVRVLVHYQRVPDQAPFDESGAFEPGLDPFAPSRPAATELAKRTGQSLGVQVKPTGNRRLQPVADKFFYWLRASMLETNRISYWWAGQMVTSAQPLQEKLALFWHGHFATNEEKVRDYRKMLKQLQLFRDRANGNFRDLLIESARDPAMLVFLDAGLNVKGKPNENFAREIMELFTMGPGNYTETDIREAARAFTGWDVKGLDFVINADKYDDGEKSFLGKTGRFDGVQIIDQILQQPVTAEFVGAKLYRFFSRDTVSAELKSKLGDLLRSNNFEIKPFLTTLFLSRDFYSAPSYATRIKSPVELVVSTYRKLGLQYVPGIPDFNSVTGALGQHLMHPPTVAGWAYGKAWITPGLLIERGNFARDVVFHSTDFVAPDRVAPGVFNETSKGLGDKLARGMDITSATKPEGKDMSGDSMSMSNQADRDEDFNTRYASFRGWQMATERVKPIERSAARIDLTQMVMSAKIGDGRPASTEQAVDVLLRRFMRSAISGADRARLIEFLSAELGTTDLTRAQSYMEEPLRQLLHLIMSLPEYQLG